MISFLFRALKIRPDMPDAVKNDTYECGVETEGDSWVQFNFKYYLVALLFVVFDVEVVFLYTWAVAFPEYLHGRHHRGDDVYRHPGHRLLYAWRKQALEWRWQ